MYQSATHIKFAQYRTKSRLWTGLWAGIWTQ